MVELNFISGCVSSAAVFCGIVVKPEKAAIAFGIAGLAIGVGCIQEELANFLKRHTSAYVIAVGCGVFFRWMTQTLEAEKIKLQEENKKLRKESADFRADRDWKRGADIVQALVSVGSELYKDIRTHNALEQEKYDSGYREGLQQSRRVESHQCVYGTAEKRPIHRVEFQ